MAPAATPPALVLGCTGTVTKVPTVRVTMAGSVAGPTGQVANTGTGFVLSNGTVSAPAAFIFATLDGHIEAWNPMVDALIGPTENKATVPGGRVHRARDSFHQPRRPAVRGQLRPGPD
jgi:hypothetical protein